MSSLFSHYLSFFPKRSLRAFFVFLVFLYFALNLLQGDRGYIKLRELRLIEQDKQAKFDAIQKQREILENQVVLLRNKSLDKDILDEQIRDKLGYVDKDDIVLFLK